MTVKEMDIFKDFPLIPKAFQTDQTAYNRAQKILQIKGSMSIKENRNDL